MAQFEKHFVQDLTQDIKIQQGGTIVFNNDNLSNVVGVALYNGKVPASVSGTVVGAVIAPDGATVPVDNGTISGNTVSITLTRACFALPGNIGVGIQVVTGDVATTVLKVIYNVELFSTDTIVDPDSRITLSLAEIQAKLDEIPTILANAQTAIDGIEAQKDTMIASIASVAGQGTDTTLTQSGVAADAKATGDQVRDLKSAIDQIDAFTFVQKSDSALWGQGYWAIVDGEPSGPSWDWIRTTSFIDTSVLRIFNDSTLLMYLQAWNKSDNTYIGTWNGNAFTTTYVENTGVKDIDFLAFQTDYPLYKFKISIKEKSGQGITPEVDGAIVRFVFPKIDEVESKVNEVKVEGEVPFTSFDLYENGEISITANMYEVYPAGSPTNRARAKQSAIQMIPSGATSISVEIYGEAFNNGKYKIGWAQYTKDYVQITSTVVGWITSATSFTANVHSDAKYFMFYYATVNDNDSVDINELTLSDWKVEFNNSTVNFGSQLKTPSLVTLYQKIDARLSESYPEDYFMLSINHRGYSEIAPENTIQAYILSKKMGFNYAECDVEFTSDDVAVLLHDSTINRTARNLDGSVIDTTISIGDITYNEALEYDFGIWKGSQWAGTKIPTFEEFIVACKKLSLHPVVELKDVGGGTYWNDARISNVANIVKKYGMEENVSFISFAIQALTKISAIFPKAMLGMGYEESYTLENIAAYATEASSLLNGSNIVLATVNYTSMTDAFYEILTNAGLKPIAWTVNTKSAVLALNASVYGVLSDVVNAGKVYYDEMMRDSLI